MFWPQPEPVGLLAVFIAVTIVLTVFIVRLELKVIFAEK